jgi:ferredoxin-fold anticodon binding domain-containing protein
MGAEAVPEILNDIYKKLSGQTKEINITVENMSIRSDADLYEWSKKTFDLIKQGESKEVP